MAGQLARVEERERRQLAGYLHDAIGQNLALTRIKLGALRQALAETDHADHVQQIRELVEQSIQATRSLTFELSPPLLHDLGLAAAVEWLTEDIEQRHGLRVSLQCIGDLRSLDQDTRTTMFSAVRELLINVVKHARADHAEVRLQCGPGRVRASVADDGRGFDPGDAESPRKPEGGGFGLFSLKERLQSAGGELCVESEPGTGTVVRVKLPLNREPQKGTQRVGDTS
jgi:signal transduction histidine kinase